jgi:hypothetical protein
VTQLFANQDGKENLATRNYAINLALMADFVQMEYAYVKKAIQEKIAVSNPVLDNVVLMDSA